MSRTHSRRYLALWYTRRFLTYTVLIIGAVAMLVPFIYMVTTSLKTMREAFIFPPTLIPSPIVWDNYPEIFRSAPLGNVLVNSLKISTLATLGVLCSSSLAGFTFARLTFVGKNLLFSIVLAVLMVPFQVTLIPEFLIFRELGWVNTHLPLIVPYWFGGAFGTFLARQFFLTIPQELADAAKVDGCNPFRVYAQIFLPLAKPVLGTLAIFTFLGSWNDLLTPLIYLRDPKLMTFPLALSFFGGRYLVNLPLMMAAAVLSIAPTLVLFLLLQRYFVQGVVLSGLKA